MWSRIKRVFRSIFGAAIEAAEDPELILRQNLRDLEDQVPKMNESIAMVRANVTLIEQEMEKLTKQEAELTAKIKAALKAGRRDIAVTYATQLEQVKQDRAGADQQHIGAKAAYEKALQVKKAFMAEKDRKVREAQRVLAAAKRSEWQKKVADTMETFHVGGIDHTHDEMLSKLEKQAAVDEARMAMALDNIDSQGLAIEEEAKKLEANETLRQFELELGLVQEAPPSPAAQKTIGGLTEG